MPRPEECRFTRDHEWIHTDADGVATVGVTDFAQQELGDIVYVQLGEPGRTVGAGDQIGEIESVKAVAEVYAPVGGEIVEVNEALADSPELVNSEPMEAGWLVRMRPSDPAEIDKLMSWSDYEKFLSEAGD
ncbi:MAG: glycine cleavage system protein GcvH [Acidobacteriota bacterium]|nr:MAG: glycine cleavage system protein GcvH [Acidobacteriota bacterium]